MSFQISQNVKGSVLSDVSVINGLYFEQLWYVDHHNVLYNGHIICVKQSKKSQVPKVIIAYWKNDECEEEGKNITVYITIRAIGRLYNGRPKFGYNVYLTLQTL